jgi:hypothetical protein
MCQPAWEDVINILLGVCLIASPCVLSFTEQSTPTTNCRGRGIARDRIRSLGDAHENSSAEVVA